MIRRPPRSTQSRSSAASDVYKRQEQYERDPQKAHPWSETRRMTYRSSKSVHFCALGASRRIKQKIKKGTPKKPKHVFFHVFAKTTHVVAAPRGFACVVIPAGRLYIPSFIEIRSRVSEPQGVKIWPFPLLWLVAFTTACTTVQAVTSRDHGLYGSTSYERSSEPVDIIADL